MPRQKLIDCFQDTLEMSKSRVLKKKTSEAIKSNKVYKEEFVSKIPKRNEFSPISVHEGTTFEIAKKYRQFGQIAVLNFANPEYPGGGVWNGAMAQEECLCRSSNLYACISNANVFDEYYAYHRNIRNQFYTDRLIYTKNVTVFKNDDMIPRILPKKEWFDVDVITCAAPYLGARKYTNSTVLLTLFKSRIKNIFEAAKDNCVDVIVLGAFGCGAFKNPPKLVAQAFYQVIREQDYFKDFKQIVFAIKSTSEFCPNLSAFIQQFDQYAADARLRCSILPEPPEWRFCRMPVFLSEISNDMKGKFYSWQKNDRYFGKQFSILGDSISTLDGYNPKGYQVFYSGENYIQSGVAKMSDTWWDQVISFFGGELLVNNSWSGSRVTKIPQINQLFPSGCSDERTSALHINNLKPDVIIVYLGTNDWAFSVTTGNDTYILGEDRHERFDDAYSAMLRKIKKNYPDSELWCCTLCTTYMSSNPEFQFPHKYGGTHIEEYNEIIRRIVRENGCTLIDLSAYNQPYDTMDGTHPNEKGMQTLAQLILCEKSGADMAILFSSVKEQMAYVLPVEEINMQEESEYVMLPSGITSVLYSDTLSLTFENAGGTVKFKKTEVHVGRDSSNDFCFTENIHVEPKHATFFYENQSWFLRDNGSINGTWINDKCMKSWKKYQLSVNDEIRFANSGKVIFYKLQNSAQQSETQFEGTIINGRYRVLHLLMPEGNNQCYMVYDDNFNRNLIMEVYDMRNKNDSLKMRNIILQDIHRWMSVKHSLIQ